VGKEAAQKHLSAGTKLEKPFGTKARINKLLGSIPFIRRFTYDIPVAYDNICIVQKT
jgi:hypothetical protein